MGLLPPHHIMHSYFCHCHTMLATGPIPLAMQALGEFSSTLGTQAFVAIHSQTNASRFKLYP
jgi:hypothetical protein